MSGSSVLTPDAQLDLRGTPCPINFVRTKLRLEKMPPGGLLEVWLDPGEPIEQVPDSLDNGRLSGRTNYRLCWLFFPVSPPSGCCDMKGESCSTTGQLLGTVVAVQANFYRVQLD